jgi:4-diphosphocytidyl-2C-methyl-D-erythritol kinase
MVELLRIVITDRDVHDLADELGIDPDVAVDRAQAWLEAIGETASALINQQLASVVAHDTP